MRYSILLLSIGVLSGCILSFSEKDIPIKKDTTVSHTSLVNSGSLSSLEISMSGSYEMLTKDDLRKRLTPLQYKVTQENGTERPFNNEYFDNKHAGIYVDLISGIPLFSSRDKYDSGTGWPSFTRPIDQKDIVLHRENESLFPRTEVRSALADTHLGHVFDDGPTERGGQRYCINSAALRFISLENMEQEGYENWMKEVR